jgi:hypothetical protein
MRIKLRHIDGTVLGAAGPQFPFDSRWRWMAETIAEAVGCTADQVQSAPDDGDILVVDGRAVATIERRP